MNDTPEYGLETEPDLCDWLRHAQGGVASALGWLLEHYRPYLLAVANRNLDRRLRAKIGGSDLVQKTFLDAEENFAGFAGTSAAEFQNWLRKVLINNLEDVRRRYLAEKRAVNRELPLASVGKGTGKDGPLLDLWALSQSDPCVRGEESQALEQALLRLPEEHRRVIHLRYWEGCSFKRIGDLMDRSPEASRKLWGRAIARLQQQLASRADESPGRRS